MSFSQYLSLAATFITLQIICTDALTIPKCKGLDIKATEEQVMSVKECAKSVGIEKNKMTLVQMNCLSKCIMEKKELVDHEGKPHKENILKATNAAFPDSIKEEFVAAMGKCLDEFSGKGDPTDEKCMAYGPLAICTHKAFMKICEHESALHPE